jgi:hypothetical protein
MKDWDPPLLNRPASNKLLSAEMFRADAEKILENWKAFEARRRVAELRKSCGVEPKLSTINIRRPPRYAGSFN